MNPKINEKIEDYKAATREGYDRYVDEFAPVFDKNLELVKSQALKFCGLLNGKSILDVGSGPGSHAEYLQSLGLNVMCVDISEEMLKKCESRGLKTLLVDLEHLHFPDATIDGIWAYASLLHVRKEIIPKIARNFARMLKPKGILAIGVKKGNGEGFETREKMPESKWYFSYFQDDEMRKYFSPYFEIIDFSEETARGSTFLHYIMRKR